MTCNPTWLQNPMNEDHGDNITIRHLCPLPHAHAPQIDPPASICHHHTQQVRDRLADITRLWQLLPELCDTRGAPGGSAGTKSQPPVRLDILAITDPATLPGGSIPPAVGILTDLADWIADQRHLTTPTTAVDALRTLNVHYPALTTHPDPQSFWGDLADVLTALRRIAGETRHPVATCQQDHPDPQIDGECGGPLMWTGRNRGVIAACNTCGDTWTDAIVVLYEQQQRLRLERETG